MKILEKSRYSERIIDVFGIYWTKEGKTLFFGVPNDDSYVFAYSADKVEIIDSSINFKTVYLSSDSLPGVFHWALIEKKLLDEIIDGDLELREEFLNIVRSENVIDW